MSVVIVPAPPKNPETIKPVIWDTTFNYKEDEQKFYARSDIDHKVYISEEEAIYVNPNTGEIKTIKEEN